MNRLNFLISLFLLSAGLLPAAAQDASWEDMQAAIEADLHQVLDTSYEVQMILPFNEYEGSVEASVYPLDDPYGTLKDHLLFGARSSDWVFGLFKENRVVWVSPEKLSCSDIQVYGSMDLNLDGRVDIMVNCALFGRYNFRGWLYIYAWDGNTGELISHVTSDEYGTLTNHIESFEASSFGILDLDGDGIMEIKGLDPVRSDTANYQFKYWSWNEQAYGDWPTTPAKLDGPFYPANMAEGRVEVQIARTDTGYVYSYTVWNSPDSKRRIGEVNIDHGKQEQKNSMRAPEGWRAFGSAFAENPFTWDYDSFKNTRYMIHQGDSLSGMELHSTTPPRTYAFYIRSEYQIYDGFPNLQQRINDIKTNSFKGVTLAPGPDPDSLGVEAFADSLSSWTDFACERWAEEENVCSELKSGVAQVRLHLTSGNTQQAAAALQEFIDLVQAEEHKSLTAEGYALLYYNALYLSERLEEEP